MSYRADNPWLILTRMDTHTDTRAQATIKPEGQNWPRVKRRTKSRKISPNKCTIHWSIFDVDLYNIWKWSAKMSRKAFIRALIYHTSAIASVILYFCFLWKRSLKSPFCNMKTTKTSKYTLHHQIKGDLRDRCGNDFLGTWHFKEGAGFFDLNVNILHRNYRKVSNISRTKCQNLNDSPLVLQLSVPNLLKPSVRSITQM